MRDDRGSISRLGAWLRDNGWKRETVKDGDVVYTKGGLKVECDSLKGIVTGTSSEGKSTAAGVRAVDEWFCLNGKDFMPFVAYLCDGLAGEEDGDGKGDTGGC